MKFKTYTLDELLEQHRRWSTISSLDIITKYLPEAAKDDLKLEKFIKQFNTYYPFMLQGIVFSSKRCVYPLNEWFKEQINEFPNKNIHKYGSTDLSAFISLLKKQITRNTINLEKQKSKFLYQAVNALSSEDYQTLLYILNQELCDEITQKLYNYVNDNLKQLLLYHYEIPRCDEEIEKQYSIQNIVRKFIILPSHNSAFEITEGKSIPVKQDDEKLNKNINIIIKYINEKGCTSSLFLYNEDRFFAEIDNSKIIFYDNMKSLNTLEFDIEILNNAQNIFCESGLLFKDDPCMYETITAKSFEIISGQSFYEAISMLKLKLADETTIDVKVLKDVANDIAKNTKKFKLLKFKNSYFYKAK